MSVSESQAVVGDGGSKENRWSDSVVWSIGPSVRVWKVSTGGVQDGGSLGNGEDHGENKLQTTKILIRTPANHPTNASPCTQTKLLRSFGKPQKVTLTKYLYILVDLGLPNGETWLLQNQRGCEKCLSKAIEVNWWRQLETILGFIPNNVPFFYSFFFHTRLDTTQGVTTNWFSSLIIASKGAEAGPAGVWVVSLRIGVYKELIFFSSRFFSLRRCHGGTVEIEIMEILIIDLW